MRLARLVVWVVLVAGCDAGSSVTSPVTRSPSAVPAPPSAAPTKAALPAGFVRLSDVDSSILQDIRYATEHNFVGRRIDGYREPGCVLTERAAQALRQAQNAARAKGLSLKVYDCYRPLRAGADFLRWSQRPDEQETRAEFYPNLTKAELFKQGYVSSGRSPHSRGSTVDITLVALPPRPQRPFTKGEALVSCLAPVEQRFPDNTIDMGTGYDCFDSRSHTLDPRIAGQPRQNRLLLRELMSATGFRNYAKEWWHYGLLDEPFPQTYFDFVIDAA